MDDQIWNLTLRLLAVVDGHTDPRVTALAHLGATLMLFEVFDPETANWLLAVVECRSSTSCEPGHERRAMQGATLTVLTPSARFLFVH